MDRDGNFLRVLPGVLIALSLGSQIVARDVKQLDVDLALGATRMYLLQ